MAGSPHDGTEPDESRGEPGDPGHPDVPDQPDPGALPEPEMEARWAEIVTHLDLAFDDGAAPDDGATSRDDPSLPVSGAADDGPGTTVADPRGWVAPELDEHFEPPEPGPVFGGDPLLTMAWVAVVGPLVLLVVSVVAWRDIPSIALRIAGVAFLVGIGVLFWRMPASRDDDAGPGAVV